MSREINAMSPFTHNLYLYQLDFYQESLNDPTLAGTLKTHLVGRVLTLSIALALHAEAVCRAVAICFLKLEEIFCQVDNESLIQEQKTLSSLALSTSLRSFIGLFDKDYLEHYVAPPAPAPIQPPVLAAQPEPDPIEQPVAEPQQEPVQPPQVLLQPPRPPIQDEEQNQLDPWRRLNHQLEFGPYPDGVRGVPNTGLLPPLPIHRIGQSEDGFSDYDNAPLLPVHQHPDEEKEAKLFENLTPRSKTESFLDVNNDSPRTAITGASIESDDRPLQAPPLLRRGNHENQEYWQVSDLTVGPYSTNVCHFGKNTPIRFLNATINLQIKNEEIEAQVVGLFDPKQTLEAALFLEHHFVNQFTKIIPMFNEEGLSDAGIRLALGEIFTQLNMQFQKLNRGGQSSVALIVILNDKIWVVQVGSSGLLSTRGNFLFEPRNNTGFGPLYQGNTNIPIIAEFPLRSFNPQDKILIATHTLFKKVDTRVLRHWMEENDPQIAESIIFSTNPTRSPVSCLVLSLNPHHVIEMD